MRNLKRIVKYQLCLGCSMCETLGEKFGYVMVLGNNGFYNVALPKTRSAEFEKEIGQICPSINLTSSNTKNVWGELESICYAWSNNPEIRFTGSSGGLITGLATFLLKEKVVDAVLHVGQQSGNPLHNELKVSRTAEDLLGNASSRYAPAMVFRNITTIFDSTIEKFCFIGKPCDVVALKKMLLMHPVYSTRIRFYISLVCAGISSYNGTMDLLIKETGRTDLPLRLKYRGDGWPGYFTAIYQDGYIYKTSYLNSYGNYLSKFTHSRCKICPDGIGLSADLAVGDAWKTKDGYPDFEERPGRSFVLVRTNAASEIINQAAAVNAITLEHLEEAKLKEMQPYQYHRRIAIGYRLIVVHVFTCFLFNLKKVHLLSLMKKYSIIKGIKEMIGTLKRIILNRF